MSDETTREFLPRFRLTEGYVRPHAYKRQLNLDAPNANLLEDAARVLDGYAQPTAEERAHLVVRLNEAAERMLAEGWYMTDLTMRSAAHYISREAPEQSQQPPVPGSDNQP